MVTEEELPIELEAAGSTQAILGAYDPRRHSLSLGSTGDFLKAISFAHSFGKLGRGRCIAIVDGPCDLEYRQLKTLAGGRLALPAPAGEDSKHGTAVALLVAAAAPECKLDLYAVTKAGEPRLSNIVKALDLAARSSADVINLSLGRKASLVDQDRPLIFGSHCQLCSAAAEATRREKLVVAAGGNALGSPPCPARDDAVLAAGFRTEKRVLHQGSEGRPATEAASWQPPT